MPVSIFTETQTRARTFPTLQFSSLLFVFAIPRSFTVFGEWAQLSGVLVLYGTYGAHNDRMIFDCSIGGALRGASADLLSRCSYGRSGCAVSSLRKLENDTQSTRLFFRFHTTISQGEWPDHRRVRPSLTIHFHSCKWLSGSVRVPISLAPRVLTIGRAYVDFPDGENKVSS